MYDDESLIKSINYYQHSLNKYAKNRNNDKLLHVIRKFYKLPIKVTHLEQTGIGRTVNGLRKLGGEVGDAAKALVARWKEMVVQEEEEKEKENNVRYPREGDSSESETNNEQEDGNNAEAAAENGEDSNDSGVERESYVSGDEDPPVIQTIDYSSRNATPEKDEEQRSKKRKNDDRDNPGEEQQRVDKKYKPSESTPSSSRKSGLDSGFPSAGSSSRDDGGDSDCDKHTKDRSKHHKRDKSDSKSSKSSSSEKKHKSHHSREKDKSHKSDKHKNRDDKDKQHKSSSSHKSSDKHSKSSKSSSHSNNSSSNNHSSSSKKESKKSDSKSKSKKPINGEIDCNSGTSFAEALGMLNPSASFDKAIASTSYASTDKPKKAKKESSSSSTSHKAVTSEIPKLLADPGKLTSLDLKLDAALPPITPNYRPLGNMPLDVYQKKMSDSEALSRVISQKNMRTKVYSGNKVTHMKVPSLFEMCIRVLQDNIDALEYTGGVPYSVLKPVLEKASATQLFTLEHHNPYLIEDSDELWQLHCQREFRNKTRDEMETWREMYMRCIDERNARLKALTATIKQSQDKSLPVRTTKLAYVDSVVKPPREIARKQAKNGTAAVGRTASKLSSLAMAGEAGKVAVPNPEARAVDNRGGASSSAAAAVVKPKKAPLMAKSLSLFKNRFRR